MAKLRKMLGDIESQECKDLMSLIETQSSRTLALWAAEYVKESYLPIYETSCPGKEDMRNVIQCTQEHLEGKRTVKELKITLAEARKAAAAEKDPVAQAAARAISTACAVISTPTGALGFAFYGAAAAAYSQVGLMETEEVYRALAGKELQKIYASLKAAAIEQEPNPAKIKWGC